MPIRPEDARQDHRRKQAGGDPGRGSGLAGQLAPRGRPEKSPATATWSRPALLIGLELDWLYALGVRQITPIHLTNNAFGGTAIYMRFLETVNVFVTGERWTVEDAWQTGVRYRLDHDGDDLVDDVERTVAMSGGRRRAMHRHTLVDHIPGYRIILSEASRSARVRGGHANVRSLNQYGVILLEEMMKRGMIIDVDHMSEKSTDAALDLAETHQYPVITSHSWFRDLLYSADNEFNRRKMKLRHQRCAQGGP